MLGAGNLSLRNAPMKILRRTLAAIALLLALGVAALALVLRHDAPCAAAPALAADGTAMQAIVYRCYGSPEVLRLEHIAKPVPAPVEILVRVHAASVNPLDWHYMRGTPYLLRTDSGVGAPQNPRFGTDFAGTVEAIGQDVTHFRPGDAVFGDKHGAFAEYLVVREDRAVVLKPENMSFEQAAAVPIAGVTALQALRDKGQLRAGQQVLINGASGGVGTFAVQIAKSLGAEVTGVCSARNVAMVRSLGADHVIDYSREDFTRGTARYDLIIDTVSSHSLLDYRRVLKPRGTVVIVGGTDKGVWLGPMLAPIKALLLNPFVGQRFLPFLADMNVNDLNALAELMRSGKLTPVIDRRYSLAQASAAMNYVEAGHAQGKVIISVP